LFDSDTLLRHHRAGAQQQSSNNQGSPHHWFIPCFLRVTIFFAQPTTIIPTP
jgi:hypothetical protein